MHQVLLRVYLGRMAYPAQKEYRVQMAYLVAYQMAYPTAYPMAYPTAYQMVCQMGYPTAYRRAL